MPRLGGQTIRRDKPNTRAQRRRRREGLEATRLRKEASRAHLGRRAKKRPDKAAQPVVWNDDYKTVPALRS